MCHWAPPSAACSPSLGRPPHHWGDLGRIDRLSSEWWHVNGQVTRHTGTSYNGLARGGSFRVSSQMTSVFIRAGSRGLEPKRGAFGCYHLPPRWRSGVAPQVLDVSTGAERNAPGGGARTGARTLPRLASPASEVIEAMRELRMPGGVSGCQSDLPFRGARRCELNDPANAVTAARAPRCARAAR
jgi:hypothetical protein